MSAVTYPVKQKPVTYAGETHNVAIGYVAWFFYGIFGLHRFYYNKPISGLIWLFTFGLLGIGWIVDAFLIPQMNEEANQTFARGKTDYTIAWLLFFFLGVLGVHRMYCNKWFTGIVYLCTFGLFGLGYLYDFFVMNHLVDEANRSY